MHGREIDAKDEPAGEAFVFMAVAVLGSSVLAVFGSSVLVVLAVLGSSVLAVFGSSVLSVLAVLGSSVLALLAVLGSSVLASCSCCSWKVPSLFTSIVILHT